MGQTKEEQQVWLVVLVHVDIRTIGESRTDCSPCRLATRRTSGWVSPYTERQLACALLFLLADTAHEEVIIPAYGTPDGTCDNMVSAPKSVTNMMQGNRNGVVVRSFVESSKNKLSESLTLHISVEIARKVVTMGMLAQFREMHKIVVPSFNQRVAKTLWEYAKDPEIQK